MIKEEGGYYDEAIAAAKAILAEKSGFVLIFEKPEPTQVLTDYCVEGFNAEWRSFMNHIGPLSGQNPALAWVWVEKIPEKVGFSAGYDHMEVVFFPRKYKSRIFLGEVRCGSHQPHKTWGWDPD